MSITVERNRPSLSSRMGLRRLFPNASARDISRALVRREGVSVTDTIPLSVFGHGQDTRIQNSTVNTTVNYHYTLRSPLESDSTDGAPQQHNVQPGNENASAVDASAPSTTVELRGDSAQSPATEHTGRPRDAREVYVDIMITKNRGFPLWIPSPNKFLPPEYRYSGVSIGDVGVLTPEGGFDFIFNIFADAGDRVNANSGLTNTFSPLRPPLHDHEIQCFKENIAGTLVADDSFERTDNVEDESKVILTTSALEAAVLMMPEDVYTVKLQNQERLRGYVSAHIATWYAFVRRTLGRDVSNGDLRVVYGYRKSTAFGIAAISTAKSPSETRLTFCEREGWARQSGYKYRWSQVGSADVKTGPEYRESAQLMYPAYGTSRTLPENQCLFVSTVDAKLSAKAWRSMEALPALGLHTMRSEPTPLPSQQPDSHAGLHYADGNSGGNPSADSSMRMHALDILLKQPSEPINHPSSILNDVLLETNPEAYVSIVCDDDWENYMRCQDPLEFVSSILCQSSIRITNGILYLEQSPPPIEREHHPPRRTPSDIFAATLLPQESLIDRDKFIRRGIEAKTLASDMIRPDINPRKQSKPAFTALRHRHLMPKLKVQSDTTNSAQREYHPLRRRLSDPLAAALLPPPDESAIDRDERLRKETEAKKVSGAIDDMIRQERSGKKKNDPEVTVLLLGQSESGKSTTLKQFQLLHSPTAFSSGRIAWREVIYLNLLHSIKSILDALAPDTHPLDDSDEGEYSPEMASVTISASGRPPSAILGTRVSKYDHYRLRLEPLADLEEKLFQTLYSLDEGEATQLGLSRRHWEHYTNFYKNKYVPPLGTRSASRTTIVLSQNSEYSSEGLPIAYRSSTGNISPPPAKAKEIVMHTSKNWEKPFALGKSKSPKSDYTAGIEGWWEDPEDPVHVLNACAPTMLELWRDLQVRKILQEKRLCLEEASGFYLEEIPRITAKKYVPTDADVLKARLETRGVVEHNFSIPSGRNRGVEWRIYDFGGARNQREEWVPYFEDANTIIFLAPISAFDQVLAEDLRVNRLEDSLKLWRMVVSNKLLAAVSLILCLNKCDFLQAKLQAGVKLNHYMLTYGDRPNDYNSIVKYFKHKFTAIHETYTPNKDRNLHIHLTAMTDTSRTAKTLSLVRDIIIKGNIRDMRLV